MPDKPDITKTVQCRVGRDYRAKVLFINELQGLDTQIANLAAEKLKIPHDELHSLTASLINLHKKSKYGGGNHGLTKKVLNLTVTVKITHCELIDDGIETDEEIKTKEASE